MRMSAFEREREIPVLAIKRRAPRDELADALRAFGDEFPHGVLIIDCTPVWEAFGLGNRSPGLTRRSWRAAALVC